MTRRTAFFCALSLWTGLYLASFVVPAMTAPVDDGFTRGLNRIGLFVSFQAAAGLVALVVTALRPHLGPWRFLGLLPIALAGLLLALFIGLIVWARMDHPVMPDPPQAPRPMTVVPGPSN